MFYFLIISTTCLILEEFRPLVQKVLNNTISKVPKHLRENTKYPGNYTINNMHFTLHKVVTSVRTNDIKSYAIDKNCTAILKRKNFLLEEGFVFLDLTSQEFYIMEKLLASDEKINIYKTRPIDIFHVLSDIEFDGESPLYNFNDGINWNKSNNRPILHDYNNVLIGAGFYFTVLSHSKVHFNSIKKAEIATEVTINGKVGTELNIKKSNYFNYHNITIVNNTEVPIPGLTASFNFLGLKFEIKSSITFSAVLQHIEASLGVDIDHFKGYQFTAKRFISVKCNGVFDSGWQTDYALIPSSNLVEGNSSLNNINKLSAVIEINQGLRLIAIVASSIHADLQFGLLKKFTFDYDYNPIACPFPYLYGNFELPISSYITFTGVEIMINLFRKNRIYNLLQPLFEDIRPLNLVKTGNSCLFDSANNNDHLIIDVDNNNEEINSDLSNKIIYLQVNNLENCENTSSLLSFRVSLSKFDQSKNTDIQIYDRRQSSYQDISSNKNNFDQIIIAKGQNSQTSKITFNFYHLKGVNTIEKSNDFTLYLKDFTEKDDKFIQLSTKNPNGTENLSFNVRLNYCQNLSINKMYVPSLKKGIIDNNNLQFGDKLCVIVKDTNSNTPDYVDENAEFITDGTLSQVLIEKGVYTHEDEFFKINLINIDFPFNPDSDTFVNYEIRLEWGENYAENILLVSNFTNDFKQGLNNIQHNFSPKFRMAPNMRLFIFVSYIHNYNVITLNQQIYYSEIIKIANSIDQLLTKKQQNNKISCTISVQRYTPIVLVNCSQTDSVHRIVTHIYSLNSTFPSQYKPQVIKFKDNLMYGVFQIKRIHKNIRYVIIHMPLLQPLCNFTIISDEYYQIPLEEDIIYIPFRKVKSSINEVKINHVIQGNFVDDEINFLSNKYYSINFDENPVALAFVRTINNQYSAVGVENTEQTLIDYGNEFFQILVLSYKRDRSIEFASSLIIIDENNPYVEVEIPNFTKIDSSNYEVYCERADEIMIYDKTTGITIENNKFKNGMFFTIKVTAGHIISFMPVCKRNLAQSMCFYKQTFSDSNGYAVFRYPDRNGITIFNPSNGDLFKQEDRQGLIEEIIKRNESFYYMSSSKIQYLRTYAEKMDLELRIIEVKNEYKKFCIVDKDGNIIPFSRIYYTDNYFAFMNEFGIQNNDEQYYDFTSIDNDSCIYAFYSSKYDTNYEDSKKILSSDSLYDESQSYPSFSTNVCDIAKSLRVIYYDDIKELIPPAKFNQTIYIVKKEFSNDWINNPKELQYEIDEYFKRAKENINPENNSIFCLYLPYDEFTFTNKLQKDEFISANKSIIINYEEGILNYILPENYHTIINVRNNEEINLNIYGKGTLEFKTNGQSKLKILGELNLDSVKTIIVDNNIDFVEIENVNTADYVELNVINKNNENVHLKINKLKLLEHSKANLTNVEINNEIIIKQTATAFVDRTVTISNSDLFIEMIHYQNDLIPMISGILPDPPKKIFVKRLNENQGPKKEEEYKFFDGEFDCQLWIEKLDFGNSYFNNARCSHVNNADENLLGVIELVGVLISFADLTHSLTKTIIQYKDIAIIVVLSVEFVAFIIILAVPFSCGHAGVSGDSFEE